MSVDLIQPLNSAFQEAWSDLIVVAIRGGVLAWAILVGKVLSTGFVESPSIAKIILIFMPISALIAALCAAYGFKFVVNPGESEAQAIHDAEVTFFIVLMPLWAGCIWGMSTLRTGQDSSGEAA